MTKVEATGSVKVRERANDKVEVTEEMTDAGLEAAADYYCGDGIYALTHECLSAIFTSMVKAANTRL